MATVITERFTIDPPAPPRKRWTREEYKFLDKLEAFEGQHFELVCGELINKMGKGIFHTFTLRSVVLALGRIFGHEMVLHEPSIDVAPEDNPTSEPEPDVIVLTRPYDAYGPCVYGPADIAIVAEIADSTLQWDRTVKAGLYARAGIPEYWIFDVNGRRVLVHRDPVGGEYRSVVSYSDTEAIEPMNAPGRSFSVRDAFPK